MQSSLAAAGRVDHGVRLACPLASWRPAFAGLIGPLDYVAQCRQIWSRIRVPVVRRELGSRRGGGTIVISPFVSTTTNNGATGSCGEAAWRPRILAFVQAGTMVGGVAAVVISISQATLSRGGAKMANSRLQRSCQADSLNTVDRIGAGCGDSAGTICRIATGSRHLALAGHGKRVVGRCFSPFVVPLRPIAVSHDGSPPRLTP